MNAKRFTNGTAQRSYILYAPTPWDSPRQPAHNLADALARHHRVLYVDPPLSPLSPIRYGWRGDSLRRMAAILDPRVRQVGALRVFGPVALPPIEHPRMRALSLPLLRAQIAYAARRAKLHEPVMLAWRGLPQLAHLAGESVRVGMIMDHPAAGASLLGRDAEQLEHEASAICESANLICTTSQPMHELLRERGWENQLVPFGFPAQLAGVYDSAAEPSEYAALPRPLLGYTGGIDDRLDFDLVLELADRFSHGSLVFVGAVSPRLSERARCLLAARKNIHLLGPKQQMQLPAYVRHLDVALMPYADTLFTRYQSPMKMWEYLYAGPPIVGSGAAELRRYPPPLVSYGESDGETVALIEQALADPEAGRDERRRFALANTWDDRASELDALVSKHLDDREQR